jgi:hypothetical protein
MKWIVIKNAGVNKWQVIKKFSCIESAIKFIETYNTLCLAIRHKNDMNLYERIIK